MLAYLNVSHIQPAFQQTDHLLTLMVSLLHQSSLQHVLKAFFLTNDIYLIVCVTFSKSNPFHLGAAAFIFLILPWTSVTLSYFGNNIHLCQRYLWTIEYPLTFLLWQKYSPASILPLTNLIPSRFLTLAITFICVTLTFENFNTLLLPYLGNNVHLCQSYLWQI